MVIRSILMGKEIENLWNKIKLSWKVSLGRIKIRVCHLLGTVWN